jgi:hypothetical protein
MADELGSLSLGTEVDLAGLREGLDAAKGETEGQAADIAGGLSNVLSGALAGAGVLAAGAIVGIGAAAVDMASQANQATNDIQAQLGTTREEAEALTDVALDVFGNNWGTSVEDATASLVAVRQQVKGLADEDLAHVTEGALALRDTFGVEVAESTNAVNTLMTEFGLSSQQALDFVTKGFQSGLDSSGDFLDTIGEYGVQFGEGGADAEQFFSVLQTGLQGGVLGTDKIADAFKESRLRIMGMSDDVVNAFALIGDSQAAALEFGGATRGMEALDLLRQKAAAIGVQVPADLALGLEQGATDFSTAYSSLILGGIEAGTLSVADAQQIAIAGLGEMDNAVYQNTAGVAIFGTQWEDAGAQAILGIDMSAASLADMAGSTDSLNAKYSNLQSVWDTIWRQLLLTIMPIGTALLDLANVAMPVVLDGFTQLQAGIAVAVAFIGPAIQGVVSFISGLLAGEGTASLGQWGAVFEQTRALVDGVMAGIMGIVGPILAQLSAFWAEHGAEILATATETWNQISAIISGVLAILQATIIPILTTIGGFIAAHGADIQAVLGAAWANIRTLIGGALAIIQGIVTTVLAVLRGDWSGAWTAIQGIVTTVLSTVQGIVSNTTGAIMTIWSNNLAGLKGAAQSVWDGITGIVQGALDGIIGTVTGMGERFLGAGAALINNLKDGFMGAIDGLIQDAKDKLQELADLLPGSEPKDPSSPLRGLGKRGAALVANFQAGIDGATLSLRPTLEGALGGLDMGGANLTTGGAAAQASADVTVRYAPGGESWLRNLVRVEVADAQQTTGRMAKARSQS